MPELVPLLVAAAGKKQFSLLGIPTSVLLDCDDTGGQYYLTEQVIPPGLGVPPHVHGREDELFFVLEGEVQFLAGDQQVIARSGDTVFAPREVPHAYQAIGEAPARMRFMAMPGNIQAMFEELSTWPSDAPPDMSKLEELCNRFGIQFV